MRRQPGGLVGVDPRQRLHASRRRRRTDPAIITVCAHACQSVEMPDVCCVAPFADGGIRGSTPYAASGADIDRMSEYYSTGFW